MDAKDTLDTRAWAEKRVLELAAAIRSYIDMGLDLEEAADLVFNGSILAFPHKMRALELVANYRHEHRFVPDKITGRMWCASCQSFQ